MPPPLVVTPQDVQLALRRLRRFTNRTRLERLEQAHPELANLLMESAGALNHRLSRRLGPVALRRFTHRIEDLGVLLVEAVVVARVRQWQERRSRPLPPPSL